MTPVCRPPRCGEPAVFALRSASSSTAGEHAAARRVRKRVAEFQVSEEGIDLLDLAYGITAKEWRKMTKS